MLEREVLDERVFVRGKKWQRLVKEEVPQEIKRENHAKNTFIQKEKKQKKGKKIRSPKGNSWSAIPVALLCMIVN